MLCAVTRTGFPWFLSRQLWRAGWLGTLLLCLGSLGWNTAVAQEGAATDRQAAAAQQPRAEQQTGEGQREGSATVADVVAKIRPSLATIRVVGRDAAGQGLGTGFLISTDGLIATNLHVIGQGRQFTVELADGQKLEPVAIHAFDQAVDLAVIRVAKPDVPLQPLELAEPRSIQQGAAVVAMGNPWGLRNSVVSGVVSALREIDGQELLQLAMPIEPGNSGGPLVDMAGRVHGVINMKSTVQQNVAFAIQVEKLQVLLERPNSIPIERWVTIGAMDKREWQTLFGANWRQQSGRIQVSGQGQGYGGRSLCLSSLEVPEPPYEVGVSVKLEDEGGAAGLVFHSDGKDKHYGFYPSNGSVRLSCFRGPDVFSWQVLYDRPSEHYRQGSWNYLKVRVEPDRLLFFLNDQLVLESTDRTLTSGRIGLAKFRQTVAEFKDFRVAKELPSRSISPQLLASVAESVNQLPSMAALQEADVDRLAQQAQATLSLMDSRRTALEAQRLALQKQIDELAQVAEDVRVREITRQLEALLAAADEAADAAGQASGTASAGSSASTAAPAPRSENETRPAQEAGNRPQPANGSTTTDSPKTSPSESGPPLGEKPNSPSVTDKKSTEAEPTDDKPAAVPATNPQAGTLKTASAPELGANTKPVQDATPGTNPETTADAKPAADAQTAAAAKPAAAPKSADQNQPEQEAKASDSLTKAEEAAGSADKAPRVAATDVLLRGTLLIANLDERDIDIESYVQQVQRMAAEIRESLPADAKETQRLAALDDYLFTQNGFHGSRFDYDHRANSYMNRVIDDREGLPITLSVLYMELGRLLNLRIDGLSLPGKFAVRWVPVEVAEEARIIDVFDGARTMSRDEVSKIVREGLNEPLNDEHLRAATHREILSRMLNNLYNAAERQADRAAMLRYLEARLVLEPDSIPYRGMRAVLRAESGRQAAALADLDWIIEKQPPGVDIEQIMRMRENFSRRP